MLKLRNFVVFLKHICPFRIWYQHRISKKLGSAEKRLVKLCNAKKTPGGTFHNLLGQLATGQLHDWIKKEHLREAEAFRRKDGGKQLFGCTCELSEQGGFLNNSVNKGFF